VQIEQVIQRIGEIGIIPVVRAASEEEAARAIEAICAAGVPIVEITMTVPDAVSLIGKVARRLGGTVLIGAGTVTSSKQANACIDAGAKFIVSPGLSIDVLAAARDRGTLAIPGALSPTELMTAFENGAKLVKIFPCGNVGGPKYVKSLRGPFPNAALIPTGGVNAANAGEFISAGAFAIGVGADLVDLTALRTGHPERITESAQELVQAVVRAREGINRFPAILK
jgi:2-dehydro-3-deoxyphosphogluconate aldolase / (4S)-4-hydroxy-2-oxoglutarate aldolase